MCTAHRVSSVVLLSAVPLGTITSTASARILLRTSSGILTKWNRKLHQPKVEGGILSDGTSIQGEHQPLICLMLHMDELVAQFYLGRKEGLCRS